MYISEFDYNLPQELIAQQPLYDRAAARMLVLQRNTGGIQDAFFRDLPSRLQGNELVVVNNARVIPARLFAHRSGVHAEPPGLHSKVRQEYLSSRIEILLARQIDVDVWDALVRPGRKIRTGERLFFEGADLEA